MPVGYCKQGLVAQTFATPESENVVMHQRIVPWGTRTVVAVVVTLHIRVAGEPIRVVVGRSARSKKRNATRRIPASAEDARINAVFGAAPVAAGASYEKWVAPC